MVLRRTIILIDNHKVGSSESYRYHKTNEKALENQILRYLYNLNLTVYNCDFSQK